MHNNIDLIYSFSKKKMLYYNIKFIIFINESFISLIFILIKIN